MNALLAALAVILGAAISVAVRGGALAVIFCAVVALLGGFWIGRVREQRTFLLQIFVGGLLVRVVIGTIINVFELQAFFGGDAVTYDVLGKDLLDSLRGVAVGTVAATEWSQTAGGWGMLYLVAAIYGLVGQNMLAVQFFNAVVGAATAPVIFLCAHHIFQNLRVAKLTALFVAFFPSLVLWSSQGLKDGPIVFLLAVAMLSTLKLGERLSLKHLAVVVLALSAIITLRFYVFYMLVAAIGGAFVIGMRPVIKQSLARQLFIVGAMGLALTYMGVLRRAGTQLDTYANLQTIQRSRADLAGSANSGFGQEVNVSTTAGALSAIPIGFVYLMFAPFPWQVANLRQSITLPEMIVWWGSFPFLALGVWFTIKYRLRQALPILIFTTMLTLAYSIFQGNVGTAYRQRSQILIFYFIFVAVGFVLLRERQEDKQRQAELAKRRSHETARAIEVEARRRYEQWKDERGRELEAVARNLSEKVDF